MKKVRNGVFETNSSSTHSICIAQTTSLTIPTSLHFGFGDFGWETSILRSPKEKASYLYTGLIALDRHDEIRKIITYLKEQGLLITSDKPQYKVISFTNSEGQEALYTVGINTGYIDHVVELADFLTAVCENYDRLMRYLFSDLSYILTGNDNEYTSVEITESYPYEGYFKGN